MNDRRSTPSGDGRGRGRSGGPRGGSRGGFRIEGRRGDNDRGIRAGGRRDGGRGPRPERRDERGLREERPGGSRARYGRPGDDRAGGGRRAEAHEERGAGARGRGPARREEREPQTLGESRRGRSIRGRYGKGGARTPEEPSGAPYRPGGRAGARQPVRDPDFYPADYTDERDTTEVPGGVRLQKVLAAAGVASRRACEQLIGEGRVTVDGQVVRRFGARVDPARQVIHVDGKRIPAAPDLVYLAINKPIGVISTMSDPEGRPSLADYVADRPERLFHVGRLDTETEGLIILTNDGELAHRLTHPSYGVLKKYWAKVPGPIPRDLGRRLRKGIELEDGLARVDSFRVVQEHGQQALVEVVLHEGRKHIVRRLLEQAGHRVIDLARIEFGPVQLGRLKPGTVRSLTLKEVGDLYAAVGL